MIGCIKAISPCVKSASPKLFLDLHTVLAPSGEQRTLGAAAQVERTGWCCRRFDSDTQTRCGSVTVMVLVSSASGPRVRGCPRAPRYFHPNPVTVCTLHELVGRKFNHEPLPPSHPPPLATLTQGLTTADVTLYGFRTGR